VECKWLSRPVETALIHEFAERLRERGLESGLLVSNQPASLSAERAALDLRSERMRVIFLDGDDLSAIEIGSDLESRVREKLKSLLLAA
jgi:hypothetical protein